MKLQLIMPILLAAFASACVSFKSDSDAASTTALAPSPESIRQVEALLDKAMQFQEASERLALTKGRALTKDEAEYAAALGIEHPEKIRVRYQWRLPKPHDPELLATFKDLRFGSWLEGGRTNGYGIFVKSYFSSKNAIIRHELVHVLQAERMGLRAFTRQYLIEAMTYGYFDMPLEAEAFKKTEGERY